MARQLHANEARADRAHSGAQEAMPDISPADQTGTRGVPAGRAPGPDIAVTRRFLDCTHGGALVEYALLVSLIAGAALAAVLNFGVTLEAFYTQINNEIALTLGNGEGPPAENGNSRPGNQPSHAGGNGLGPCNNPGRGPHC